MKPQRTNDHTDNSGKFLWCAVIDQALIDAGQPLSGKITLRREQENARAWLTGRHYDFHRVCDLAGVEPDNVRKAAIKIIAEASKHDAPAPLKPVKPVKLATLVRIPRNAVFDHDGRSLTIAQWSKVSGIGSEGLRTRLSRGMTIGDAIAACKPRKPRTRHHTPGVVADFSKSASDRTLPSTQETSELEFFK